MSSTSEVSFFELAKGAPFHRTGADWSWDQERARVFARYRER
jgi:hypothetical protein